MKILITGGIGFIGSHLVNRLLTEDHEIEIWDNLSTCGKDYDFLHRDIKKILNVIDVSEWDQIENRIYPDNGYDLIYHLAAQPRIQPSFKDPYTTLKWNIQGMVNILKFAMIYNNVPVILAGSSSVNTDYARNPYSYSKKTQEDLCEMYHRIFGMPIAIIRFYNVYGPGHAMEGDYSTVIGIFERQYLNGEPLTVVGNGNQIRTFTHIEDIVEGLIRIGQNKKLFDTHVIHLGHTKSWCIIDIARLFGNSIINLPERPGESHYTSPCIFKLKRTEVDLKGWKAKINLKDYIENFKATHQRGLTNQGIVV